ncbi:MAG TPA: glycosyltransferase family 1 protein [Gemmatimonadales bacterium]
MTPIRIGMTTLGADGGRSGIGTYVIQLLREFEGMAPAAQVDVVSLPSERDAFAPAPSRLAHIPARPPAAGPIPELLWHQTGLRALAQANRWDALFLPAANRRLSVSAPCPTIGTVHDLASRHLPEKYDPVRSWYNRRLIPRLIRRLAAVITVSECSKRDIVAASHIDQDRVVVIPNGVDHRRFRPRDAARSAARLTGRYGLTGPFILYVARLEHPGKNHVRLVEAFDRFRRRTGLPHQLVLAGPDWSGAEQIHAAIRSTGCPEAIRTPGFVAAGDLPDLYAAADLLAFPSLYEGFGLPVLEAMAMGTPVACSRRASLPEVAGDAAVYFEPDDPADIADAMEAALQSREALRTKGLARSAAFTWRRTAEQTLHVITRTLQHA